MRIWTMRNGELFISEFLILLILVLLISSCETVQKRRIDVSRLEKHYKEKIKESEEYLNIIENRDFSLPALSRHTDDYFEAKEMLYKIEMERYEKELNLFSKDALKVEPEQPIQDYAYLIKSLKVLAEKNRYGERADMIRYTLGYALYTQGEFDDAIKVFEDLLANFPWSDYILEVRFRLAELYFETGQTGLALDTYAAFLDVPDSVFYEKTLYKIGWIYYKTDDLKKAAETFLKIIDRDWVSGSKQTGLVQEAMSSLILALDHFKKQEQVLKFLGSREFREYTPLIIKNLGEGFINATRYEEAITLFEFQIDISTNNIPSLPFIYEKMANLYERTDQEETSLNIRWKLVQECNQTTEWYGKNYPKGSEEVDTLISKTVVSISRKSHVRGKKRKDQRDLSKAITGYRMYLTLFPKSLDFKEIKLSLAEALFEAGRYDEAALEYRETAPLYPEGLQRGEISYSAFLTYEIVFYKSPEKKKEIEVIKPAAEIFNNFRSDLSEITMLKKTLYKLVDMYTHVEAFNSAIELLRPFAKGKGALNVYNDIAELYMRAGNQEAAEKVYSKISNKYRDANAKIKVVQLNYQIAEDFLKAEKYAEAIERYHKAYSAYPGYEIGEAALMKLGNIYVLQKNADDLIKVIEHLLEEYPYSKGALSLVAKGRQWLEKKEPLKAAGFYERVYSLAHDSHREDAQKLLLAAGILYEKNRNYSKAVGIFKRYLQFDDIPFQNRANVLYRLGYIQLKGGEKREGLAILNKMMELKDYMEEHIIAETNLVFLKEKMKAYYTIRLTQPFEETFKKKTLSLNSLLKEYAGVAKQRIPKLLPEIFFNMGIALEHFRDSIIQAESPNDLSEEELEEYTFLLEETAYPYDDQAVKAYEKSMLVAKKNRDFNNWAEKSLKRLADLRPAIYKREMEEGGMELIFIYPEPVMTIQ